VTAGSRGVIATLWDVDDREIQDISIMIHGELCHGSTASVAVRAVQLRLINSPVKAHRNPKHWAALQTYGTE
jgi:CHAT domain-containing protein